MTETINLSYNNQSTDGVFQVSFQENGVSANAQVNIVDVVGAQDTLDAVIAAAKAKIGTLSQ